MGKPKIEDNLPLWCFLKITDKEKKLIDKKGIFKYIEINKEYVYYSSYSTLITIVPVGRVGSFRKDYNPEVYTKHFLIDNFKWLIKDCKKYNNGEFSVENSEACNRMLDSVKRFTHRRDILEQVKRCIRLRIKLEKEIKESYRNELTELLKMINEEVQNPTVFEEGVEEVTIKGLK